MTKEQKTKVAHEFLDFLRKNHIVLCKDPFDLIELTVIPRDDTQRRRCERELIKEFCGYRIFLKEKKSK